MGSRPGNDGTLWTREQLILAFDLYCRIPFRATKANNPKVKELASLLHRTPASIARKLGNFGSFDPRLSAQNIVGLSHGSHLDRRIWEKFHNDWGALVSEADTIRSRLTPELWQKALVFPDGPSERLVSAKARLHQSFFRDAVLSSYERRCCITGLAIEQCLIAGHIIPWSVDIQQRANPRNGICLSATFDRLFECGLITLSDELVVDVSPRLLRSADPVVVQMVISRHGQSIIPPSRFSPDVACLQWHLQNLFQLA